MKIFVTGATGFIGCAFCQLAVERGHEVLALCRPGMASMPAGVEIAVGSLEETPWEVVSKFAPEVALHLAWIATPGVYLTSPANQTWLDLSKAWFKRVQEVGVQHVVGTGTCIEYAASTEPLEEIASPLSPMFPYSKAKVEFYNWLREGGLQGTATWSWLRVFYPFGPGEHPSRVCTSWIEQLSAGKTITLKTPHSVKDYIYIDDIALAFCMAVEQKVEGPLNVGSGQGIRIEDLAKRIAIHLGVDSSLVQHAQELGHDPTPVVVADNTRLRSLGWGEKTSLDDGLQSLIHRVKTHTLEIA